MPVSAALVRTGRQTDGALMYMPHGKLDILSSAAHFLEVTSVSQTCSADVQHECDLVSLHLVVGRLYSATKAAKLVVSQPET